MLKIHFLDLVPQPLHRFLLLPGCCRRPPAEHRWWESCWLQQRQPSNQTLEPTQKRHGDTFAKKIPRHLHHGRRWNANPGDDLCQYKGMARMAVPYCFLRRTFILKNIEFIPRLNTVGYVLKYGIGTRKQAQDLIKSLSFAGWNLKCPVSMTVICDNLMLMLNPSALG